MHIVGKERIKLSCRTRDRTKILGNYTCILDTRRVGIAVGETVASAQGMRGISAGRGKFEQKEVWVKVSEEQTKGVGGEWEWEWESGWLGACQPSGPVRIRRCMLDSSRCIFFRNVAQ